MTFEDVLKTKVVPGLAFIGKYLQENPEDTQGLKAAATVLAAHLMAYGAARKTQPSFEKLFTGEPLSRKESRQLYMRTSNLISSVVATTYLAYRNAQRLDDYNNR